MYLPIFLATTNILFTAPKIPQIYQSETIQNSSSIDAKNRALIIAQQPNASPIPQNSSESSLQETIDIVRTRIDQRHAEGKLKEKANDLTGLGTLYRLKGETKNGLKYIQSALEIHHRLGNFLEQCNALNALGDSYKALGEYQKALNAYKQSLSISANLENTEETYVAVTHGLSGLAGIYIDLGETKEVLNSYTRMMNAAKKFGYDKDQVRILNDIGNYHFGILGNLPKAQEIYIEAKDLDRSTKGKGLFTFDEGSSLKEIVENLLYPSTKKTKRREEPKKLEQQFDTDAFIKEWEQNGKEAKLTGNTFNYLNSLTVLSIIYQSLFDYPKMLEISKQKLDIHKSSDNLLGESQSLTEIATVLDDWDRKQEALNYYNQALQIQRQIGVRPHEAQTLELMGELYESIGAYQLSLEAYNKALSLRRYIGDLANQSTILSKTVGIYQQMNDDSKALDIALNQYLPLAESTGNRLIKHSALINIGSLYRMQKNYVESLKYLNLSLDENLFTPRDDSEDNFSRLSSLGLIGATYRDKKDYGKAQEKLKESIRLAQQIKAQYQESNPLVLLGLVSSMEAYALLTLGNVYEDSLQMQEALEAYKQAHSLFKPLQFRLDEAKSLKSIATVERKQGNLDSALQSIEAAITIVEEIRQDISSSDLRTSFLATKQDYYKVKIRILMELHQQQPSKGYDAVALETSERARARGLLDLLIESRVDIRQGVSPQLLEQEKSLKQKLASIEKRRVELASNILPTEQDKKLERETSALLAEFKEIQSQIQANSPRYAALTQPQSLTLAQIQQQLLDDNTLLLEYSLGEEESYLWAVSKSGISSYTLPKRSEIEEAAKRFRSIISDPSRGESSREIEKSAAFSQMILGKVANQLGQKRLLIVSDGILQYTPFAALPDPAQKNATSNTPLIVGHEIVHLPSASTLSVIRQDLKGRKVAPKNTAIFANPIFDSSDPRLLQKPAIIASQSTTTQSLDLNILEQQDIQRSAKSRGLSLAPLPGTQQEAEEIVKLVPNSDLYTAFGLNANKVNASQPALAQYRIVHFATHGLLDAENPERSGIALSLVNNRGQPQDGFLRLNDIFNLKLPAELVVLSACQTGLGKEIKGEGLVGLTRGFMYAGAPRVLVSLWNVSDASTAKLMTLFYKAMLNQRLTPAAALRSAQIQLSKDPTWNAPYHWAAFTLQGEWQP